MTKNTKISLIAVLSVFIFLNVTAAAETQYTREEKSKEAIKERMEERKENMQERADKRQDNRCEVKKNVVDRHINMFQKTERFHKEKYSRMYERITNLIERLDEQDIDTTQLKSYMEVLKGKIDTMKADYETMLGKLEALKDIDCEDKETSKAALDEIRALLDGLKVQSKDIADYFGETVKPELKRVLQELKDQKESEDN